VTDPARAAVERRVLILAPSGRDAALAHDVFARAGIAAHVCADLAAVCAELDAGSGALLIAEEAAGADGTDRLTAWLGRQSPWSDLPVLLLARPGADSPAVARAVDVLGNVTVLERPARIAALVTAARTALRSRDRQYQARQHLLDREQTATELRTLMDLLPVGVFIAHDPACRRITGNRAVNAMLRMPPASNLSRTAPPAERPTHFRPTRDGAEIPPDRLPVQRAARGEVVRDEEVDQVFDDGTVVHTLISASPLLDAAGAARGAVASITDITALKRAERGLLEAQRVARVGSWEWDAATDRCAVSDELCRIYGLPPGAPIPDFADQRGRLYPPASWERLNAAVAEAVRTGEGYTLDVAALRAGEPIWVTCRSEVVRDAAGRVVGLRGTVQDITDRKRAEDARWASEERFRAAVGATSDLLWTNDAAGQMTGEQPGWGGFTGQSFDEYLGYGWSDAVHPDDARPTIAAWERAVAERRLFAFEHRVRRRDGACRLFTIRAVPLLDPDGAVREWVGVHTDITDQRAAEEEIRASEARARFLDAVGEATRATDDPAAVMAAAARVLGEHLAVTRCAYADVDADGDRFTIRDDWRLPGVATTAGVYSLDLFGARAAADLRAGRVLVVRDVDAELSPADGADTFNAIGIKAVVTCPLVKEGRLRAMMAVHSAAPRDWTADEVALVREAAERAWAHIERVRSAAELRAGEERFRTLVEQVQDYAIFTTDPAGRATSWNEGVRRVLGFDEADFVGAVVTDAIFTPEDVAAGVPEAELAEAAATGRATNDRWMRRTDGTRFYALGTTTALHDAAGRLLGYMKVMRDQTDRKRMEDDLRRAVADLSDADRRKNEFLAMLAHELRNPLAPIRNSLHILKLVGAAGPETAGVHDMIERQVGHMVRLVDDLLEVSRITRGKIDLRRAPVELAAVLRTAVETSRPLIDAAGHALTVDAPAELLVVDGDAVRLAQVFANLLNNAAKYTDPGGAVRLAARRDGADAVVTVRDTGAGIPAEMLGRVFDLFTQIDRSDTRAQGGLGIGLTLVKSLVELHGGRVAVRSDGEGKGSEFEVRLPLAGG